MAELVTFGEIMLRLSPEDGRRMFQNDIMRSCFGGSEANVASLCSMFGVSTEFVSRLPDNVIGEAAICHLHRCGTGVSHIVRDDGRMGVYYYEKGAGQRPATCLYDRAGSSFSRSDKKDYDWERILRGASVFHVSGITPALSSGLSDITLDACMTARRLGVTVSCDLNYRAKLWDREKAYDTMRKILPNVDIFTSSVYQANDIFGSGADITFPDKACVDTAKQLYETFGPKIIALTVRKTLSADKNAFYGMISSGGKAYFSKKYETQIVDRVGSGDAYQGALLYSFIKGRDLSYATELAAAAAVLKHSVEGDTAYLTLTETEALAAGTDGRIQR